MAAAVWPCSTRPLCGMEYHQPSNSSLLRTNPSGISESPFLGTSASDLNQISSVSMASGLIHNDPDFSNYSQHNPNTSAVGDNVGLVLGSQALLQRPDWSPASSLTSCTGLSGQRRKKQKREQADYDCPLKKRKLSVSPTAAVLERGHALGVFTGVSPLPYWNPSQSHVKQTSALPDLRDQSFEMMHTALTEYMEEVPVESQCEATLRRIRDIESRLVVEDDDEQQQPIESRLPTLVMSDVLVEGLKKGLDESLTKKIVDSMNRPSMELVLWKPQPEFLIDKLQSIASSYEDDSDISKQAHSTPGASFPQEEDSDKQCTPTLNCDIDTMWNRDEEEMEL
ncbi:coiled-coil domain-containing protein 117 isoform X2 [Pseudophryne corroboree]